MKANLQKIGNSTGAIIPAHILKKFNLKVGVAINIIEEDNRIIIEPVEKELTLKAVLASCSPEKMELNEEDKAWLKMPRKGIEIL
ncbi:MAG: AbrB/MazE/SpoVT family DNA-binding domain-containing protein [Gammaproteobacteria bacterium]|nr:AbrB/MazE/SpoVT family DNA-binding domain-containing protein [Gammaproteobacteria bacterium]